MLRKASAPGSRARTGSSATGLSGKTPARASGKSHLVWRLQKYARLVPLRNKRPSHGGGSMNGSSSGGEGTWKHYDDAELDGQLRISILEGGHLLIGVEREVYESLMMWNAHKWLKVARKGDSLLFVCVNVGQASQRFRVRFHGNENRSSEVMCQECAAVLGQYTQVKDLATSGDIAQTEGTDSEPQPNSQPLSGTVETVGSNGASGNGTSGAGAGIANQSQADTSTISARGVTSTSSEAEARLSIGSLAQKLVYPAEGEEPLSQAYNTAANLETAWPSGQLKTLIHLCLTDSNFPSFVEQVEKELNTVMDTD